MKAVKTIAALIFLTAIGIVLIQPVLGADDGPIRKKAKHVAAQSPDAEETPGSEPSPGGEEEAELTLLARYPKQCMTERLVAQAELVAARRGSSVSLGLPGQDPPQARFGVSGDVVWSPSGSYLAERGGELFDISGTPLGRMFFESTKWQWSVGDCVVALTGDGNLTFGIPETRLGVRLAKAPISDFELSPNGRRMALVVDGGLWIADLRRGRATLAGPERASLVGWFSNRTVLYTKSEGSGRLRFVTGTGNAGIVKGAFAGATLARCTGRTLLAAPDAPLAELVSHKGKVRSEALPGTPATYAGFSDASCSPDGGFIVASALTSPGEKGPLVLLGSDGTFVREIMRGRTANPTWTSQGVLFVKFGGSGRGRLWFIPPNGAPAPTAYTVGAPNQYDWAAR